jgi:hypothetical protein
VEAVEEEEEVSPSTWEEVWMKIMEASLVDSKEEDESSRKSLPNFVAFFKTCFQKLVYKSISTFIREKIILCI